MVAATNDDNGRVTLAILKTTVDNLQATVERNHREVCQEIRDLRTERAAVTNDHEARLRSLENKNVWGNVADVGAYLAALVAAFAKGSP